MSFWVGSCWSRPRARGQWLPIRFAAAGATIRNSTIGFNDVLIGSGLNMKGGGIYNEGTLHVIDSAIRYNEIAGATSASSLIGGGGIYSSGGELYLNGSIVEYNTVGSEQDRGGIYVCSSGELYLANATVTDNRADSDDEGNGNGGGIYLATFNQDSGIVHLKNTIIDDNSDLSDFPGISASDCYGEVTSEGYNLIGSLGFSLGSPPCSVAGDTTTNLIGFDAMVNVLADNGGPTLTHGFLTGSPALNTGDPRAARTIWEIRCLLTSAMVFAPTGVIRGRLNKGLWWKSGIYQWC